MSIGSRMKERRESLGLTQVQLADMLGVTKGAIGNYETGANSPKASLMFKVFEVLQCDANYIFQDEIKELETDDLTVPEIKLAKKYRSLDPYGKEAVDGVLDVEWRRCTTTALDRAEADKVIYIFPGYSMPMSAGTGQPAGSEYPENYRLVKEPPRRATFIAPVSGDSMEPTYHDGDKLFIRSCPEIEVGQVGVFLMDGQQWVKELGDGVLISHNPKYEPITMTNDIRCQGLVLGVCDVSYFE